MRTRATSTATNPAAGSAAKDLPLPARTASFTTGPANSLYVVTGPSVLRVDSAGKATQVLGANDQNARQVPDPASDKPFDKWTPALSTRFLAAASDSAPPIAASPDGTLATLGELSRAKVPDTFAWHAESGDTELEVDAPDQAGAGVAVLRNGSASTATLIGTTLAFRGDTLLVATSREGGGVVVAVPIPA